MRINTIELITRMHQKDMNQKQLAASSGVNRATISNVIRGCACSPRTAERLAAALGVTIEDITGKP